MEKSLLYTIYENDSDVLLSVRALLDAGHDPNYISDYNQSALRVASKHGRFDVIKLLLAYGADESQLGWTELFHAIAYGTLDEVQTLIDGGAALEARDCWSRTPFLFSLLVGDAVKSKMLLQAGADPKAVGRCNQPPLAYAIVKDDVNMLGWLIRQGFDIEQTDEFGDTPLITAAKHGSLGCLNLLIQHGVDIAKPNDIPYPPIHEAHNLAIAHALLAAGADINDMSKELRAQMLGYEVDKPPHISKEEYFSGKHRVFGISNPELSTNPFCYAMVKAGGSAYHARSAFNDSGVFVDETALHDPSVHQTITPDGISKFMVRKDQRIFRMEPVWSYDRFGKSITPLTDGRFIEIAGEHEDEYDPDFCIYNDVFVHTGKGECEIYLYPRDVFPPTDFHTATLVEDHIYIIGSLGYWQYRRDGYTPVYRLDIHTLQIQKMETGGDMPGWIHSHKARYKDGAIIIKGGEIVIDNDQSTIIDNTQEYSLCLKSLLWKKTA